jgi:16S rRNA (guanine527-N7)-methyltransferase
LDIIEKYFPELTNEQFGQLEMLQQLYAEWNEKINVISRKDTDNLMERHVLHSLAIAKFMTFAKGTRVLDIGTGGGFPGIPLAIFFPDTEFVLCDSIAKKIHVAESISETIGLRNTDFVVGRAEQLKERFDFIVSRAVAPMEQLYRWSAKLIKPNCINSKYNGFLLLKGGDLAAETKTLKQLNKKLIIEETPLNQWFDEPFFETKKLIYIF